MAAIDKLYGTKQQHEEFKAWVEENLPAYSNWVYDIDAFPDHGERPMINTPSFLDLLMLSKDSLPQFVKDQIELKNRTAEPCAQYKHLLEAISKYTDDVSDRGTYVVGTVSGVPFRLFQEWDAEEGMSAYLCIKDGNEQGTKWPAFYNGKEIDKWMRSRENR
jgi:hypothetical protein